MNFLVGKNRRNYFSLFLLKKRISPKNKFVNRSIFKQ